MEYLKEIGVDAAGNDLQSASYWNARCSRSRRVRLQGICKRWSRLLQVARQQACVCVVKLSWDRISWVKRTQKDGTKREFTSPMAVAHYNKYMGGIDKAKKVKNVVAPDLFWHS